MAAPTFTLLVAAALLAAGAAPQPSPAAAPERPNIVLILTDDQRWDTLGAMPTVTRELVGRGVTFENAFAVTPTCCPSRATILTGDFAHSTGVYANSGPHGGSGWFDHDETIGRWLHETGYRTAYVGKYLNNYAGWAPPSLGRWFTPPGWDTWLGSGGGDFGYRFVVHGLMARAGEDEYFTDALADAAVSFVEEDTRRPFFVVVAPFAPHHPATPATRHAGAFADADPFRPSAFDEPDVSDKPSWVRRYARLSKRATARLDDLRRRQFETLLAVDEAVGRILAVLRADDRLENTLFVFTSDNGLLWGEHRLWNRKTSPYEESIRVPLVVRWDARIAAPHRERRLVGNLDLAPTFAEAADATTPAMEGRSLVPLLERRATRTRWRQRILLESIRGEAGTAEEVPTYCAVRGKRWKYVAYATRDEELYDLERDPGELENLAFDPAHRARVASLRADLLRRCRPRPPGLDLDWLRPAQD